MLNNDWTKRWMPTWAALTAALLVTLALPAVAADSPQSDRSKGDPRGERPAPEKEFGPEANPARMEKETQGRSDRRARGLTVRELKGRDAGKPLSALPGAKALTRAAWTRMKEIPKTGLYLVELDHVPPGLEDDLKENGYVLAEDGSLTRDGNPVALFVHGETFRVEPEKPERARSNDGRSAGLVGLALDGLTTLLDWTASDVDAASPFPWSCASWYFKSEYNGGFCRDYRAWTNAYAWGPGSGGACANPKPLTRIAYISTDARIGNTTDWEYQYDADQSHSYSKWNVGCFWPAHGSPSGFHYAYWAEGGTSLYRSYSW